MMQTRTYTFLSADGKHRIQALCWLPETSPKAILQINYGMAEYAQRYIDVAKYFTRKGFIVACHDHLGHGTSIRSPKELGYFGKNGAQNLVTDSHTYTLLLKMAYPHLPLFILGHSMGSLITEQYLKHYWYDVQGAVLMGCVAAPAILPKVWPLIQARAKVRGRWPDHLLNAVAFGPYSWHFDHRTLFAWLSRDQAAVARYQADPMLGFTFTTNGFLTLFQLVLAQAQQTWAQQLPKTFPILLAAGSDDAVGAFGVALDKLTAYLNQQGLTAVTKKEWPKSRHELFFELDTPAVLADLQRWLDAHL